MIVAVLAVSFRQVNLNDDAPGGAGVPLYVWITVVFTLIPSVLGGILEDFTLRFAPLLRLLLTGLSSAIAVFWLGLSVDRIDIAWLDIYWQRTPWLGITLALLAICGLPHAFNLIDGYNGLAGMIALATTLALIYVAIKVGDWPLATFLCTMAGATVGFLLWNYPRGLLFAGDGGAYLWGTVLSIASVALVQRNPTVSPWFPLLLFAYPVVETLFSMYRKIARGTSPGVADALHFHQLIYRRIVRRVFHDDAARQLLMRNNRTSPYLWGFAMTTVVPAVVFWNNTIALCIGYILFLAAYIGSYLAIVRFKVPQWLKR